MKRTLISILAMAAMTATALAADIKPAIIYDLGGKFDKSFNESAYNGAEKFTADTGIQYRDFEIQNDAQREQALRKFVRDGNNPIVVPGFTWKAALEKVAANSPDTSFVIIDDVVDLPNVRSVKFKEEEGSFLVGLLAAKASKTGTVSFIGGMDVPLIRAFACGYEGGAKSANPDANVLQAMTGTTPDAWNDPVKGGEIAKSQMAQGSDVVYAAAGGTGIGVINAAADEGNLSIGVDSNQNGIRPGSVLTSMLKRVDVAVYNAFNDLKEGKFTYGTQLLGLADNGVDYAMDDNNAELVSQEMRDAVEQAKADIIAGKIKVHDYRTDDNCPY